MVTPLRDRDTLDVAGLERLVDHLVDGGVTGLFLLGTTGEGPSLSYRLRRELIDRVSRQVQRRVPILVGITDAAFVESQAIARHAADAGAAAVVVAPPPYLPPAAPELLEYLQHLVAELPLPLFLYNLPSVVKVGIEVDVVRRMMDQPRVIGLKDSSADMIYFHRLCGLLPGRPGWTLMVGPEELLADALLAGGHGGVCGGANLFPKLYVALCDAVRAGEVARALSLQQVVWRVAETLYHVGRHRSAFIKGIKCALALSGLGEDFMAEPFHRFRVEERRRIEAVLPGLREAVAAAIGSA